MKLTPEVPGQLPLLQVREFQVPAGLLGMQMAVRALLAALAAVTAMAGAVIGAPPAVAGGAAVRGTGDVPAVRGTGDVPGVRSAGEPRGAARAGRLAGPALPAYNPVTGSAGFTVFVLGNAALNASVIAGPVAVGGNLTFGSATFNVATQTAGSFTASGDARPTGLLVGGNVNWAGVPSSGTLGVQSTSYVKIGSLAGSAVAQSGTAPTHIVPTGQTYSSSPQIAEVVNQPTASVNQSGLISFGSAFSTFSAESADRVVQQLARPHQRQRHAAYFPAVTGHERLYYAHGGNAEHPEYLRRKPGQHIHPGFQEYAYGDHAADHQREHLRGGRQFFLDAAQHEPFRGLRGEQLDVEFLRGYPADRRRVADDPRDDLCAGAAVTDNDSNGFNGGVIAAAYTQGGSGGSPTGGQVVSAPFTAALSSCVTPALTISLAADTATAAPGGTVHYTITATNLGSVAYTGATFTDVLSDVLDDASYDNNAAATAGSASFTSPNLTWTGNLAAGAIATITFSVTVKNPDTGTRAWPAPSPPPPQAATAPAAAQTPSAPARSPCWCLA